MIQAQNTASNEDISLIVNPSCSKLPITGFGIKKIGAPQVPSSFFGASPPNLVHSIRKDIISLRGFMPNISISCTDNLQTMSGVMCSVSNFLVRPSSFSLFETVSMLSHRCQGFWFVWSEKCNSEARRAELLGGVWGHAPPENF